MKRHFAWPVLVGMLSILASLGLAPVAQAVQILHWERLPLAIPLVVGQERVVFIDCNVRVGVPASIADHLRVQSAGGAVYLRASDPIPPTRLQLQDVQSGAMILLDIAARPAVPGQPKLEPVRIVEDATPTTRYGATAHISSGAADTGNGGASRVRHETPVPVILTRYAAQSLYAPLRTVEAVAGIGRVNVRRDLPLDTLLPALPVRARVLAAWGMADDQVTAVQLTNTAAYWIDLDPRALQGDFVAATFQHPTLGPAGLSTDTTVVYLVTRGHGLAESLLPAISPIDAIVNLPPAAAAGQPTRQPQGVRDEK